MSRHKFMVLNLRELKVPAIMLGVAVVALTAFMSLGEGDAAPTAEVFAPSTNYQNGTYLANLAFSEANMDLVVVVEDEMITSVSLVGFDETERMLYTDLNSSIAFLNNYIVATQSLELPNNDSISTSTNILMDAVLVALSQDADATLTTTYHSPLLEQWYEDESGEAPLLSPIDDDDAL